jgi:NAD(P)-dependent dehydrogenase (short-subunit alcohol dehydrogenase family)
MNLSGKIVVITGAAGGIGRALARRFHAEGARLCLSDVEAPAALASELGGIAGGSRCRRRGGTSRRWSRRANAISALSTCSAPTPASPTGHGLDASDEDWARSWSVNLMAHVYSARAVLPLMLERGDGYLLHTASAAGLLTSLGDAPYAVTKHGAVAFAEWLAAMYGDRGIKVSVLCPQGVRTPMLMDGLAAGDPAAARGRGRGRHPRARAGGRHGGRRPCGATVPDPTAPRGWRPSSSARRPTPDRWLAGIRKLMKV